MTRRILFPALAALATLALTSSLQAKDKKGGTIQLFNGKNLSGWKIFLRPGSKTEPEKVWTVKDGILRCTGRPYGYLITKKEYGDYKLTVEWRWPDKPGNSGVFMHVSGPDKIWPKGVEAQLYAGHAGDFWLVGNFKLKVDKARQDKKSARHYFRMHADKAVEKKPGQWNKYEITCKGDRIKLVVNGKLVNEGSEAEASKGKILLQSEGAPIEFRNVTLKPLK